MKHSLIGIGTGGAIGPAGHEPVSAFVLLARIFRSSGKTRVGLDVRWFSFGELYISVSCSLIGAETGNMANSGPFVFVLLSSDVPAAPPRSFCSHEYVKGSPSPSVALPVRANGVRSGIVNWAGAVTTGTASPVGFAVMPLLSTAPPLSVSPAKPDMPALGVVTWSRNGTFVVAWLPPYVTWKPVLLRPAMAPPPKAFSVIVALAGRIGASAAVSPAAV